MSNIYNWYKIARWLYLHKIPIVPSLIKTAIRILWGGVIPFQAKIGEGTTLGYQGLGIVIHKECIIGENCMISQNVTLGGTLGKHGVPKLGNHVYIGSGAKVIGNITIGNNVKIGANAVVLTDLPDNVTAVGVPAKKCKINS